MRHLKPWPLSAVSPHISRWEAKSGRESGQHGLLVPFGDTAALARAAESLIADPARRAALGAAGRQRAQALFSADRIVGRYVDYYRSVCRE